MDADDERDEATNIKRVMAREMSILIAVVSSQFGMSKESLMARPGGHRDALLGNRHPLRARWVIILALRRRLGKSYPQIAALLDMWPAAVSKALRSCSVLMERNPKYKTKCLGALASFDAAMPQAGLPHGQTFVDDDHGRPVTFKGAVWKKETAHI